MEVECTVCGHVIQVGRDFVTQLRAKLHSPSRFADVSVLHGAVRLGRLRGGECGAKDAA